MFTQWSCSTFSEIVVNVQSWALSGFKIKGAVSDVTVVEKFGGNGSMTAIAFLKFYDRWFLDKFEVVLWKM